MTKLAILCSILSGCFWATTKSEGEALRKDVTSLQGRLDAKEKVLDGQIAQLKSVLDDSSKLLKRNSADLGADVDGLRADVRTATGLTTSINNSLNDLKTAFETYRKSTDARMDAIEQRVGQIESGKPSANSSADELWKLGTQAFETQRYNDAIEIYKRLVQTYPTHVRAPDAVYFKGQAFTQLKDWDHAIGAYRALFQTYPDSSLADDALYFAALAAQELKNCNEGRTYLELLRTKYPKSNVRKEADQLDKLLKSSISNRAKCTP